ncbi:hypothetical protein JNM05_01520 [bacterium]|nr:hypothetical protein [bacterium]
MKTKLLHISLFLILFMASCDESKVTNNPAENNAAAPEGIELISKRTEFSKTYAFPDGSYSTTIATFPIHEKIGTSWIEIQDSNIELLLKDIPPYYNYDGVIKYWVQSERKYKYAAGNDAGRNDAWGAGVDEETGRVFGDYDLSSIPVDADIQNATLNLFLTTPTNSSQRYGAFLVQSVNTFSTDLKTIWDAVGIGGMVGVVWNNSQPFGDYNAAPYFSKPDPFIQNLMLALPSRKVRLGLKAHNEGTNGALAQIIWQTVTVNYNLNHTISVYSPDASDYLIIGRVIDVGWNSTGLFDKVDILSSSNGGSTWNVAVENKTNDGLYFWTIPNTVSANYKIKVQEHGQDISGLSQTFVVGPNITITGPTSLTNGKQGNYSVTTSPSGSYTYQWYRAESNTPNPTYIYQNSGSHYAGAPNGSSFELMVKIYSGTVLMGTNGIGVSCSDCGGIEY